MKKYFAGLITGIIIAISFTTYATVQLKVIPNPYPVFINNTKANVQGYNINGSTYLKLADLKATGLNVKFADSKITIASATSKTDPDSNSNNALKNTVYSYKTDRKVDNFPIYQKNGIDYIDFSDISNYFVAKEFESNDEDISEGNIKFIRYDISTQLSGENTMSISIKKSGLDTINGAPIESIMTILDNLVITDITALRGPTLHCVDYESYEKFIQPLINRSLRDIYDSKYLK